MRIARLYADENAIGSVPVEGKLPRAIVWLGSVFLRMKNSHRYKQVTTIESKVLLEADFSLKDSPDTAHARAQKMRKSRE